MKKKLLTFLLSLTLVLTLAACGNKADKPDDTIVETDIEESIENTETGDLAENSGETEETSAETSDAATTPEPTETSMPAETSTPNLPQRLRPMSMHMRKASRKKQLAV